MREPPRSRCLRGSAGAPVMVDRGGELSVGESLIATMSLAAIADVPPKSMRMAARRRDGKVAFVYTSDARLSNGTDDPIAPSPDCASRVAHRPRIAHDIE